MDLKHGSSIGENKAKVIHRKIPDFWLEIRSSLHAASFSIRSVFLFVLIKDSEGHRKYQIAMVEKVSMHSFKLPDFVNASTNDLR
jgi:hypothetical protein